MSARMSRVGEARPMPHQNFNGKASCVMPRIGAWPRVTGPSAEAVVTGNSNPDFGLFGGIAKGVK